MGKPLFDGKDVTEQAALQSRILRSSNQQPRSHATSKRLLKLRDTLSEAAFDLLSQMLLVDPHLRIDVEQALCHPYFTDLHDSDDEPISENKFRENFTESDIDEWSFF